MDVLAMKRRALAAITLTLVLLAVVIFLSAAGKTPILLILLTLAAAIYAGQTLWVLRKVNK
jgi:hypothetical protein